MNMNATAQMVTTTQVGCGKPRRSVEEERIILYHANRMEAAFQCGPRDVRRFAQIIREAIDDINNL